MSGRPFCVLLAVALPLAACKRESDDGGGTAPAVTAPLSAEPLREQAARAEGAPLFSLLAPEESGIRFSNRVDSKHAKASLYSGGFAGGGVVSADFNGDGREDLFFTGGAGGNGLYLQTEAPLQFADATASAGDAAGGEDRWSAGALAVDFDGDRDLDLVVCNHGAAPQLLINDGAAQFTDRAAECRLAESGPFLMPAVCDYDRDGDLDLYLLRAAERAGRNGASPETGLGLLLRNDAMLPRVLPEFSDATEIAGVAVAGAGLSASWMDYNGDGWPDLHVGVDGDAPDKLYHNRGDGSFSDVAAVVLPSTPWSTRGGAVGDVNGDGLDDLFLGGVGLASHVQRKTASDPIGERYAAVAAVEPRQLVRNHLLVSTGLSRLREAAFLAGVARTGPSWGASMADFDLDGRDDLIVAGGAGWRLSTGGDTPGTAAFRNLGGLRFEAVGEPWGLGRSGECHGVCSADLDGDGDLDLVLTRVGKPAALYRNEAAGAHRVVVELVGEQRNRGAVGARVELESANGTQARTMRPGGGHLSTAGRALVFGLGEAEDLALLRVKWPDGREGEFRDLASDQRYTLRPTKSARRPVPRPRAKPRFAGPASVAGVSHQERLDQVFARQPLLPRSLAREGPAFAIGDIDNDADPDLFLGGARGRAGVLLRNDGGGAFSPLPSAALEADAGSEDCGAAFFDADGDNDPDLYVVSGSYEFDAGDPKLHDRLYINDGAGRFALSDADSLPDLRHIGSCVRPSDVDGDGDLDLFLGGRVLPGEYPSPGHSRLLINETRAGGPARFVEAGAERAPGLRRVGLVTDAAWADIDRDRDRDLLVATEWGAIHVFRNTDGALADSTVEAGLASLTGWWRRIVAADFDHDGDLDFAVGNFGLNTAYSASEAEPATLYWVDYQGDGTKRIIETEWEAGSLYPRRGRGAVVAAIPALGAKFRTLEDYAAATVEELFGVERIRSAPRIEVQTLASGVLLNNGLGEFSFRAFPPDAQLAPVQGLAVADLNADGHPDIALAENLLATRLGDEPHKGGCGALLLGDGRGGFRVESPRESGVLLPGDTRALEVVDLDGDAVLDLLCPLNDGPLLWQRGNRREAPAEGRPR